MKVCCECGKEAPRLRRERCDACYMRLYRGGDIAPGAHCAACEEERREVLLNAALGDEEVVVCGNCSVVIARTRPRLESVDELRRKVTRDRRVGVGRRLEGGRRLLDRLAPPPTLDPATD